jgi:hypothetical protein
MIYPKINSLWKRQGWYLEGDKKKSADYQKGRQSFIIGDYAQEEFGIFKYWHVEEKIDGTNIRIILKPDGTYEIKGRQEESKVPQSIIDSIGWTLKNFRWEGAEKLILFGEGYGPKIQEGHHYRDNVGFMLFDVFVNGKFLSRKEVYKFADALKFNKPFELGIMSEESIVELMKSHPQSPTAIKPYKMEGIIARSHPLCRNNDNGEIIMWKLKCKDFSNSPLVPEKKE